MKIFLATSFSGKVDPDNREVVPEFRAFIEQVLAGLRENEDEVFCAIEDEGWKITGEPPEIGVRKDLEEIETADVVLALVHDQPSAGVQFELGYAVAKDKKVILARRNDDATNYFNQGVVSGGLVVLVSYDDTQTLVSQLIIALNAPEALDDVN